MSDARAPELPGPDTPARATRPDVPTGRYLVAGAGRVGRVAAAALAQRSGVASVTVWPGDDGLLAAGALGVGLTGSPAELATTDLGIVLR